MIKLPLIATDRYLAQCPKHKSQFVVWKQPEYDQYNFYPEPCRYCLYESRRDSIKRLRAKGRVGRLEAKNKQRASSELRLQVLKELYSYTGDAYTANPLASLMPKGNGEEQDE